MVEMDDAVPRLALGGKVYMTPEGHTRLTQEFAGLMRVEWPRVVDIVSWAAANADRSENADYQYGKQRRREIDRRARFLAKRLENAEVVDPSAARTCPCCAGVGCLACRNWPPMTRAKRRRKARQG